MKKGRKSSQVWTKKPERVVVVVVVVVAVGVKKLFKP